MAERLQFYHASRTVNAELIVENLGRHGSLVCHATEVPLEPSYTTSDRVECYLGDVLALYRGPAGHALVGVEVKDWGARVTLPLARRYLAAYGRVCQHFYLAANGFSEDLFGLGDVGLFHLGRLEVVKAAPALRPDPALWRSAVRRLSESCDVGVPDPLDPSQTMLDAGPRT